MAKKSEAWGVEVGHDAVKAVRLSREGKEVHLEDYEVIRYKQVLSTPDIDAGEQVRQHLGELLQKHDLSRTPVVVSLPGHKAFARFAKLPPVEPKKIPDIVRFEAVQQIPFPIDDVEWDYQVFRQDDSPDVKVGIFAITKERVGHILADYNAVDLRVDALTLSSLAMYNAFVFDQDVASADHGTILMDIGTVSTDLVIVEGGGIWMRTLPIGGNAFTEALVRAFKISFAKAENLKREAATSKYAKQIFQAMRGVFADLVQEVQRSLGYYQSLNHDSNITRLIGVGSTFRLPGLSKFLKQQLQIEVVRPDGFKKIGVEGRREAEFAEQAISLATAYGLALQGVGLHEVDANVLPSAIVRARMWRAKQPWLLAASVCVAMAAGSMGLSLYTQRSAWMSAYDPGGPGGSDAKVTRAMAKAKGFADQVAAFTANEDPRQRIENLQRVLDYRDLWPMISLAINEILASTDPQPVLLTNDYEAIARIPRDQRRRVYVDDLTIRYVPAAFVAGNDKKAASGPTFQVDLAGWTPHGNPEVFLQETLVRFIQDNADRPDLPFGMKIAEKPISYLTRRKPPSRGNLGGSYGAMLPAYPLTGESTRQDWEFRMSWTFTLKSPDQARARLAEPEEAAAEDAGKESGS